MSTHTDTLADRLEHGARELAAFASGLTLAEWQFGVPGGGRKAGVIVHHVATVHPLEGPLAQRLADGGPAAAKLDLLERNSSAAAAALAGQA